jgi:EmrB/QacA subfamily drug resistance transporter
MNRGALALVCTAQFVLQLDFSVVNLALPAMLKALEIPPAELQWVVTGYALSFGSFLLVGGRAAALVGQRRLFFIGLMLFGIASIACGLAHSALTLIVARFIQGTGGAAVAPSALALLTSTNAEGPQRDRALGIWQAMTAAGALSGVVAGGLFTQYLGWRSIFLVNPPLIAVMLLLVPRQLPADQPATGARLDIRGATLLTIALIALIFGLSNGAQYGFTASLTVVAIAAAVLFAVGFGAVERNIAEPMIPREIFTTSTRRASVGAMVLVGAIIGGYVYFVSLYLQRVEGFDPALTGLAVVPSTLAVVSTSTLGVRLLLPKLGLKTTLIVGLVAMAAGQLVLTLVSRGGSYTEVVLPGLVMTAFGMGLALPALSIAMTNGVDRQDEGLAGALFVTSQQVGAAVGLAFLASIAALWSRQAHGLLEAGYGLSFFIAAGLAVVAIMLTAAKIRDTSVAS